MILVKINQNYYYFKGNNKYSRKETKNEFHQEKIAYIVTDCEWKKVLKSFTTSFYCKVMETEGKSHDDLPLTYYTVKKCLLIWQMKRIFVI